MKRWNLGTFLESLEELIKGRSSALVLFLRACAAFSADVVVAADKLEPLAKHWSMGLTRAWWSLSMLLGFFGVDAVASSLLCPLS